MEFGTVEWALQWMRPEIAAEFDCARGPHEWVSVSAAGVTHEFCKYCPRKRRISEWPDMHHLHGPLASALRS